MGILDSVGQLLDGAKGGRGGQRTVLEPSGQCAAGNVFQLEERPAPVLSHLVDLHDIWMLQAGDHLSFDQETREMRGGREFVRQDHLQGDEAIELDVPRLVDHAHAAPPQLSQDFVARYHWQLNLEHPGGQFALPGPARVRLRRRLGRQLFLQMAAKVHIERIRRVVRRRGRQGGRIRRTGCERRCLGVAPHWSGGQFFEDLLAEGASFEVACQFVFFFLRQSLVQQPVQLGTGGADRHWVTLPSSWRTSSWSILSTRDLALNTAATVMPRSAATSAPERPSRPVRRKASQVRESTRPCTRSRDSSSTS